MTSCLLQVILVQPAPCLGRFSIALNALGVGKGLPLLLGHVGQKIRRALDPLGLCECPANAWRGAWRPLALLTYRGHLLLLLQCTLQT